MAEINSAQIYATIEPVVREWYGLGKGKRDGKAQYSKIFEVGNTDDPIMEYGDIGGPGRLQLKAENQSMHEGNILAGPTKRVSAATFAEAIRISREAVDDTKVKQIKTTASSMGRAVSKTPEYLCALFLDRGHNTSYPVTAYNQPLFSASHATPYGVTFTNTLATPSALNETAMEDIKTALRTAINQDGMLDPLMLEQWIVPSALGHTIEKLTSSSKTLGSANNDPNVNKGDKYQVFDFLTNTTRWMAQTDYDQGFYWDWRTSPQFERDQVSLTMQAIWIAWFRALFGCKDPRAAFSSNAT